MERYEPYYADDTQGVHFEVSVDGAYVQAHVSKHVMTARYRLPAGFRGWVDAYRAHKEEINACVLRTAKAYGRTIVILQLKDLERWSLK